jgi:hypothetical protein
MRHFNQAKGIIASAIGAWLVGLSSLSYADEYSFDWTNKNHMRGAYKACMTQGFITPTCQGVLNACWLPPLLTLKCSFVFCHITSECLEEPNFKMTPQDVKRATEEAARRVQSAPK